MKYLFEATSVHPSQLRVRSPLLDGSTIGSVSVLDRKLVDNWYKNRVALSAVIDE